MRKLLFLCLIFLMVSPAFAIDLKDVELGGKVQLRYYDMNNVWDFYSKHSADEDAANLDNMSGFRLYTSLQAKLNLSDNVAGFVKLTNQTWGSGMNMVGTSGENLGENKDDKVFVDNAYVDVNNIGCSPLSLRLGRQNMMYGSGFVMFDGQSQYGSTSLYFDGVKASLKLGDSAVLDGFYLIDQENTPSAADMYPIAKYPADRIVVGGLYLTAKCPVMGGQQEVYVLDKNDQNYGKDIWLTGLRLSDKFDFGLDYSAEIAYETGTAYDTLQTGSAAQEALGYKLQTGFTFNDVYSKPRPFIGYTSFGGDDSDSKNYNGWDVFYGGWPQFGDLLAWVYLNKVGLNNISNEGKGIDAYSNLNIATIGFNNTFEAIHLTTEISYSQLTLDQAYGGSDNIGNYYQLSAKYDYTKNVSFSLYAAMINPRKAIEQAIEKEPNTAHEVYGEVALKF